MTPIQAILLAILQGATEFLPISSSAHLILLPRFLGWADQGIIFDIATHAGSLAAVIFYFRGELLSLLTAGARSLRRCLGGGGVSALVEEPEARLFWGLGPATLPLAVFGLWGYDWIATRGRDPFLIAATSIGFGLLLAVADRRRTVDRSDKTLRSFGLRDGFWVGLAQALALIPGTSRSGITMTAALFLGYDRTTAARYSFLLAIPAGLLVAGKDVLDILGSSLTRQELILLAVGFTASGITAYLVIRALLAWVERQKLTVFVVYRLLLGLFILVFFL